jgi:hypothetical protein
VGTYTIKAVDDPRTLNKILYLRPSSNTLSHNQLVSLWEKKVGKTIERVYIPEDEVLKQIQGHKPYFSLETLKLLSILHTYLFFCFCTNNFWIEFYLLHMFQSLRCL